MAADLTTAQQKAVEHTDGPLVVLAGPGSGKTRVVTHRIARLIHSGVSPSHILALTFTNKAAREMAERVGGLLGSRGCWVSTFHRFCARLLRQYPEPAGLKQNFTILDQGDQVQLVRRILRDLNLDPQHYKPRQVLGRISRARNDLLDAESFAAGHAERSGHPLDEAVVRVFPEYEQRLLDRNCADFDDLLLHVLKMLQGEEELRAALDDQFRYILVDEYQDTNLVQYRIVAGLSRKYRNLAVTGDPDQSIYGWRGARPDNLPRFERDFPDRAVVSLDQNFRSTARIVRCADSLISNNPRPHRGALTTDNPEGTPVAVCVYGDTDEEARGIADTILNAVDQENAKYSDFAVFYRINTLSRAVETALSRAGIPFQVAAGFSFFERAEIRDLIGYLRVIENPDDDEAFLRILNRPARGIGKKTEEKLIRFAADHRLSVFEASTRCPEIRGRAVKGLHGLTDLLEHLSESAADSTVAGLLERVMESVDYLQLWADDFDEVDEDRRANIQELLNSARQYDREDEERESDLLDADLTGGLQGFLERVSLTSEADSVDPDRGAVSLMTLHACKGLEFPRVFIIGCENGLIPHERAVRDGDPRAWEEERRLLYVGLTRAQTHLKITQCRRRMWQGRFNSCIASPFLSEISAHLDEEFGEVAFGSREPRSPSADEMETRLRQARHRLDHGLRSAGLKLTTAAHLEQGLSGEAELPSSGFAVGAQVRHPRFGRGTIVSVSGMARRRTVTVEFETSGDRESFVVGKSPLQLLGELS